MQEVGFKHIKIWEQASNLMFESGEQYMSKLGDMFLNGKAGELSFTEEQRGQIPKMRAECVELFDKLTGAGTTDLKTF